MLWKIFNEIHTQVYTNIQAKDLQKVHKNISKNTHGFQYFVHNKLIF